MKLYKNKGNYESGVRALNKTKNDYKFDIKQNKINLREKLIIWKCFCFNGKSKKYDELLSFLKKLWILKLCLWSL